MIHETADVADVHRIDVRRDDAVDSVCLDVLVKCQDVVAVGIGEVGGALPSLVLRQYLSGVLADETAARDRLECADAEAFRLRTEDGQISRHLVLHHAVRAAGATRTRGVALVHRSHLVAVRVEVHQAALLIVGGPDAMHAGAGHRVAPATWWAAVTARELVVE